MKFHSSCKNLDEQERSVRLKTVDVIAELEVGRVKLEIIS